MRSRDQLAFTLLDLICTGEGPWSLRIDRTLGSPYWDGQGYLLFCPFCSRPITLKTSTLKGTWKEFLLR